MKEVKIIAGGKIFPYEILKTFVLHAQLHLAKKQQSNIQDFISRLQKSLLANFSASATRWPRYPDNSSLKAFISVTRTHHSSRDKALKKTDRANRGYISFNPLKVLIFLTDHPCLPGILLCLFPDENSFPLRDIGIRHIFSCISMVYFMLVLYTHFTDILLMIH